MDLTPLTFKIRAQEIQTNFFFVDRFFYVNRRKVEHNFKNKIFLQGIAFSVELQNVRGSNTIGEKKIISAYDRNKNLIRSSTPTVYLIRLF